MIISFRNLFVLNLLIPIQCSVIDLRLIVVGFGAVGQSFAKLLLSRSADLYSLYGIKPRVVACVDSKGCSISPTGLDLQRLLDVRNPKVRLENTKRKAPNSILFK